MNIRRFDSITAEQIAEEVASGHDVVQFTTGHAIVVKRENTYGNLSAGAVIKKDNGWVTVKTGYQQPALHFPQHQVGAVTSMVG